MGLSKILDCLKYLDSDFWLGKSLESEVENIMRPSKITRLKRIPCMAMGYALCIALRIPADYETLDGGVVKNVYSSLRKKGYSEEKIDAAFDEMGL